MADKTDKKPEKRHNTYENVYMAAITVEGGKLQVGETVKMLADEAKQYGDMLKMVRK